MRILILCTGNSCRSQMAEAILQSFDSTISVMSAGTHPAQQVNPLAKKVLQELGLTVESLYPKMVDSLLSESWDFVITVCGGANETCPAFLGKVNNRIHIGFDDPAEAIGDEATVLSVFSRVRNEILLEFFKLYHTQIKRA